MSQTASITAIMHGLGLDVVGTGGGCEAYCLGKGYVDETVELPESDRWYQLLTVDDDPSIPTYWDEPIEIGHYRHYNDEDSVSVFRGTLREYVALSGITVTEPNLYATCDECGERPADCDCVATFAQGCATCEARHGEGALCTCGF